MNKYFALLLICILCISCTPSGYDPELICSDYRDLVGIRNKIQANDTFYARAYTQLMQRADSFLLCKPLKVVDGNVPPTGDPHDFFAIGKYAWPNPDTPDGMPYIRIDCQINPESGGDHYDLSRYNKTISRINILSLAWFYSQDEKYAAKATELLKTWFIDPESRMNPNFECASSLPGQYNGMPNGIIFGVVLIKMLDHVQLLTQSDSWTQADNEALQQWFVRFKTWLLESEFGQTERKSNSNHGSWYITQMLAYSHYTHDQREVEQLVARSEELIARQVDPDGSLPMEKNRKWSFHYSIYGMESLTSMALAVDRFGGDLWNYQTPDGRSLHLAFNFLCPYLLHEKEWPWGVTKENNNIHGVALPLFSWAAYKYQSEDLRKVEKYLVSLVPDNAFEEILSTRILNK